LRLSAADLAALLADPLTFTGTAQAQVAAVVQAVSAVMTPEAAAYQPAPIL
jgi:adenylosuccinate lyase